MRKITDHEIESYVNNFVVGKDSQTIEENPIWLFWDETIKDRCHAKYLCAVVYHAWENEVHEWYGIELHFRWDDGETETLDVDYTDSCNPQELIDLLEMLRDFYWEDYGKED